MIDFIIRYIGILLVRKELKRIDKEYSSLD
jgi:hypothetical protein